MGWGEARQAGVRQGLPSAAPWHCTPTFVGAGWLPVYGACLQQTHAQQWKGTATAAAVGAQGEGP